MAGRKKTSALILRARQEGERRAHAEFLGESPNDEDGQQEYRYEDARDRYYGSYKGRFTPGGRPIDYTEEFGDFICDHIENGGLLLTICSDPRMPSRNIVFKWTRDHEDFGRRYAQARANSAQVLEEAALHLLMTASPATDARLLDVQVKHLLHIGAKRNPGLLGAAADKVAEKQEPIIVEGGLPEMPMDEEANERKDP